jgi:hypothetical protein
MKGKEKLIMIILCQPLVTASIWDLMIRIHAIAVQIHGLLILIHDLLNQHPLAW